MAVQKSKKSRSKAKSRRTKRLSVPPLMTDPVTGELTQRHHMTDSGYYKGKSVLESPADAE